MWATSHPKTPTLCPTSWGQDTHWSPAWPLHISPRPASSHYLPTARAAPRMSAKATRRMESQRLASARYMATGKSTTCGKLSISDGPWCQDLLIDSVFFEVSTHVRGWLPGLFVKTQPLELVIPLASPFVAVQYWFDVVFVVGGQVVPAT
jgi:hypothetical protein